LTDLTSILFRTPSLFYIEETSRNDCWEIWSYL